MDCKLDLVILGDRSDFTNDVIVKFTITATNADTGVRIPDSDITISTKPVTNGVAWKKFQEWSTPDVTPAITGHDNYTFELSAEIGRPNIMLDDVKITGSILTNWPGTSFNLYVGEIFWPYVTVGVWNNLTTYLWTVPGGTNKVKDWTTTSTNGFVVPFESPIHCTNIDVWCSFVDPLTNAYLQCEIQIMGETLRPWSLISIQTRPVLTAWYTNSIMIDATWLSFGWAESWETAGVKFTNSIVNPEPYGTFQFVQTVATRRERYYTNATDLIREHATGTNLIDTTIVYPLWAWTDTGISTVDSPAAATQGLAYTSAADNFCMYLMWKSVRWGSIPVTHWKFEWTFQAKGSNDIANGWYIIPETTKGTVTNSVPSSEYPFWTNNVAEIINNWQPIP